MLRRRGFNQCSVMASELGRAASLRRGAINLLALQHNNGSTPQARLRHDERIDNVEEAFRAAPRRIEGCTVLLIDDVITTGATTNAAALACLRAGAARVELLALARAGVWERFRRGRAGNAPTAGV